jgi:FtsZ-binding cell division protein ZapB
MHEAFQAAYNSTMVRKRFSLNVWAKVIQHHFKYHLNYSTIVGLMWDDWEVSISRSTVTSICQFFEMAGKQYMDKKVLQEVKSSGKIVLSLDGAQPVKKEPSLWVLSDRLTGNVLLAKNLDSASANVLERLLEEVENLYGVPIVAVISDKQKSIVNAVKQFNPDIPHAYCQFHFLKHVVEPIATKDSFLKKSLRRVVSKLSIVQNQKNAENNPLYALFMPISEELKCAIATRGDKFNVFPGLEAFLNLEHLLLELERFKDFSLASKPLRTLTTLIDSLRTFLDSNRELKEEITNLIPEFQNLREILSKRTRRSPQIQKELSEWTYKLQSSLKHKKLEYDPLKIKWQRPSNTMSCVEIWQQWIRLVKSYGSGILVAYDMEELDFTNNAKEQLFHRSKHHFKSLLGRDNVSSAFLNHGALHVQLLDVDFSKEHVSSVLLASETPLIEANRKSFHAQYATVKRTWRIREVNTGNLVRFEDNLKQEGSA